MTKTKLKAPDPAIEDLGIDYGSKRGKFLKDLRDKLNQANAGMLQEIDVNKMFVETLEKEITLEDENFKKSGSS